MQNYYQKEIETMSLEDMKKLQSEKLVKQVKHVYDNVEYYRNMMDEKGVKPEDIKGIEDLHKLPFEVSVSDSDKTVKNTAGHFGYYAVFAGVEE